MFAGLLTKVGIYAIIRVQTLLFPPGSFGTVLMIAALLTMIVGILGAIAQSGIKRLLSYTLVSHIGYMLFGVALGSQAGLAGAIFYVAHHILVQTALFLSAGMIERVAGHHRAVPARRSGRGVADARDPVLHPGDEPRRRAAVVRVPRQGRAVRGRRGRRPRCSAIVLVAGGALTSLLTLYAIIRVWGRAFWRPRARGRDPR